MNQTLAFSSGHLERAAHLRTENSTRQDKRAQTLVFWKGKLLVDDAGRPVLAELDHPALADAQEAPVFLGLGGAGPRFAADLVLWSANQGEASIGGFIDPSQQVHPALPHGKFVEVRGIMASLSNFDGECVATGKALIGWHATHQFCANCGSPSTAENLGWLRKCPQCGTQHFPRTDPVVIMAITYGEKLLLGRTPIWPQGMYSLLAGFIEPGETIETAVRREVLEETQVAVGTVRYVASQPWPFPMSLMFGCQGDASSETIKIDPTELADARWFGAEEVQTILAGTHKEITPPRMGTIARALIQAWSDKRLEVPNT